MRYRTEINSLQNEKQLKFTKANEQKIFTSFFLVSICIFQPRGTGFCIAELEVLHYHRGKEMVFKVRRGVCIPYRDNFSLRGNSVCILFISS